MAKWVKVGGVWTDVTQKTNYVKVGGTWQPIKGEWVKVAGTWQPYKLMGPYTLSYLGHVLASAMPTTTWDLGTAYSDRMVFVCCISGNLTSVSIGGVAGNLIVSSTNGDSMQIWYVKSPPGAGLQTISITGGTSARIAVYVLGGGAGFNPTFDTAFDYNNNNNSVTANFTTAGNLNDIIIAIGCKYNPGGSLNFTSLSSNMTPETVNFINVSDGAGGMGASIFGPATNIKTKASISGGGNDSSKSIQVLGIKFSKAA